MNETNKNNFKFKNMIISEFYIKTQKTGAGHYLVIVTNEINNEIKSYTESDMTIIDALNDEDGELDMTQLDAMQIVIRKSGFNN